MTDIGKNPRIIRLIFTGLKLTFAKGIVVTDARSTMATGYLKFPHELQIVMRGHGRSAILVDGQLARSHAIAHQRFMLTLYRIFFIAGSRIIPVIYSVLPKRLVEVDLRSNMISYYVLRTLEHKD